MDGRDERPNGLTHAACYLLACARVGGQFALSVNERSLERAIQTPAYALCSCSSSVCDASWRKPASWHLKQGNKRGGDGRKGRRLARRR